MSGYMGPKNKIAKRFGINLWGRPGASELGKQQQKGFKPKKTLFALRLDEKQKLRFFYGGIPEKKFKSYYSKAKLKGGNIGETFLSLIERRLDVVVYRMCLASTIFFARQLVSHGHILVNDKKVTIPSYNIKNGDTISLKETSKKISIIENHVKSPERDIPVYISFDEKSYSGSYETNPKRDDIFYPFELNESLIVEYYSK